MARPKKVSMQDIAEKLQISKNAVSLALANKKGVSEELKREVLQAAEELGYDKHRAVTAPEQKHTAVLVLVPERIMSYEDNEHFLFYHDLIWGLEKRLREQGFSAVIQKISADMERELKLPELANTFLFERVILFGIVYEGYAALVQRSCGEVLMFDSFYRSIPGPAATSANMEGACTAARYLIDQGHRRIGFVGPVHLTTSHEERWFGYWKALGERGIAVNDAYCLLESAGFTHTEDEIKLFFDRLSEWPTAFVCGNDRIALLLMAELQRRNIRVPQDISIIGFDDLSMSAASTPPLTTMRVNKEELCAAAIAWLFAGNGQEEAGWQRRWYVPAALVERGSVAKLG